MCSCLPATKLVAGCSHNCDRAPYISSFSPTLFALPVRDAELCPHGHCLASIPAHDIEMTVSEKTVLEGPLHQLARNTWQLLLLIGILGVALGVIVLAWPGKSLLVAGVLFGIYLVVSGVGYVFAAFGTHAGAAMRVLSFLTGVVSLVLGFFCFRDKLESILLLALWIGISWLFRGFTLLAAAMSFDHLPSRGWQVLSGVIIVIGGGVLIISPLDSIAILTLVAGCWLIAIGIVDVITAFQVRSRAKTPAA